MPRLMTVAHVLVTIYQCLNCDKYIGIVYIPMGYKLIRSLSQFLIWYENVISNDICLINIWYSNAVSYLIALVYYYYTVQLCPCLYKEHIID